MKKLILLMLLAGTAAGFAADGKFEVKNIRFLRRSTPVPKYENVTSNFSSSKNSRWLCMETVFVPEILEGKGEQWYDDVTMEGLVVLRRPGGKTDSYIVLPGKTRFFTIQADGKDHIGMFYIPAKLIDRYLGTVIGESPIHMARVAFYAPGRVLLGEGCWAKSGKKGKFIPSSSKEFKKVSDRMKEYEKNYSNVTMLRGGLFSKEKTPWVYYNYDQYDLLYDDELQAGGGKPRAAKPDDGRKK